MVRPSPIIEVEAWLNTWLGNYGDEEDETEIVPDSDTRASESE